MYKSKLAFIIDVNGLWSMFKFSMADFTVCHRLFQSISIMRDTRMFIMKMKDMNIKYRILLSNGLNNKKPQNIEFIKIYTISHRLTFVKDSFLVFLSSSIISKFIFQTFFSLSISSLIRIASLLNRSITSSIFNL